MANEEFTILQYQEVLNEIENQENHLLLGNGFNYGLGIHTGYSDIFKKMMESDNGIYKDAQHLVEKSRNDLEIFIGNLIADINPENEFLRKYVENKVKLDFMQATQQIVKASIKDIYAVKNEGIFVLLNNFSNFFTLNYDSFLYLLLLNFKSIDKDERNAVALQATINFIEEDLNETQNNIYKEIKTARDEGKLTINVTENDAGIDLDFSLLTKTHFIQEIKSYSKLIKNNWKDKDIRSVVDKILEEEGNNKILKNIDDGAQLSLFNGQKEYEFDLKSQTQNLFFLHGAFHIYRDGKKLKKITQQTDKALYDRLEEILNNGDQEIVCVFQSENKLEVIEDNPYLIKAYEKLEALKGSLVIIGSSLADNDNHIFEQIEKSEIDKVYISSRKNSVEKNFDIAKKKFPSKEIKMFSVESISYNLPQEEIQI